MPTPWVSTLRRHRGRLTPAVCLLAFVAAAAFSGYVHAVGRIVPEDDAYITYRYAKNFVEGRGLVYNEGQRVFGSSTPLYVTWLAALGLLMPGADVPALAVRSNVVVDVGAAVGVVAFLRAVLGPTPLAFLAGAVWLVEPKILSRSLDGMEGLLLAALAVWMLWAFATERVRLASGLGGLLAVTRPEGLLCGMAAALYWALNRRGLGRRAAPVPVFALLLTPGAVWSGFATWYYGTPIPHSLIAKSRPTFVLPAGAALEQIVTSMSHWATGPWIHAGELRLLTLTVLFGGALVGAVGSRALRPRDWWTTPALLGLFVGFYALANPLMFEWYYSVLWMLWFLTLVVGWIQLGRSASLRASTRGPWLSVCAAIGLLLPASIAVVPLYRLASYGVLVSTLEGSYGHRIRVQAYRRTAEWLDTVAGPATTVATAEIGALGYYSRARILDAHGLVSPEALAFLPGLGDGSIPIDFVKTTHPDWVVTLPRFAARSLLSSRWFRDEYRLARRLRLTEPAYGSTEVLIFRRRPSRRRSRGRSEPSRRGEGTQ